LAGLSVTFVGFSALVIIIRQTLGGEMSRLEILITRIFIQLGFMVAAGAMLPPLLALFDLPHPLVWRIASLAAAIPSFLFAVTYPARRRSASGVPTPLVIWLDILVLLAAVAVLVLNCFGVGIAPGPGPFAAALTVILFLSGWAYLQALRMLLKPHLSRLDKRP
jgi:cation transport ATPase